MGSVSEIPTAAAERILRNAGAERVARSAAEEFAKLLEEMAEDVSFEAQRLCQHAGRRTLMKEDVDTVRKRRK